jgi:N-acetylmuramoyl-L-alanine amidase
MPTFAEQAEWMKTSYKPQIVKKEKKKLLVLDDLLEKGSKNRPGTLRKETKAVVVHWTAAPMQLAKNTIQWFRSGAVYGSAHYVLNPTGEIFRCIPEEELAYHVGSTQIDPTSKKIYTDWARQQFGEYWCSPKASPNYLSIGIEVNPLNDEGKFSDGALTNLRDLCADILKRHNLGIKDLCLHNTIVGWKDCARYFVNHPEEWESFKKSVGNLISP